MTDAGGGASTHLGDAKAERRHFHFDDVGSWISRGHSRCSRARLTPGIDSRRTNDSAPFNVFTVARSTEVGRSAPAASRPAARRLRDGAGIDVLVIPGGFGTRQLFDDVD